MRIAPTKARVEVAPYPILNPMSSPLELLTSYEIRGLISFLNKEQELPPDLINVPSKLEAALSHLTMANSMVSCYLVQSIYSIDIRAVYRS